MLAGTPFNHSSTACFRHKESVLSIPAGALDVPGDTWTASENLGSACHQVANLLQKFRISTASDALSYRMVKTFIEKLQASK